MLFASYLVAHVKKGGNEKNELASDLTWAMRPHRGRRVDNEITRCKCDKRFFPAPRSHPPPPPSPLPRDRRERSHFPMGGRKQLITEHRFHHNTALLTPSTARNITKYRFIQYSRYSMGTNASPPLILPPPPPPRSAVEVHAYMLHLKRVVMQQGANHRSHIQDFGRSSSLWQPPALSKIQQLTNAWTPRMRFWSSTAACASA
jgi:hypothetical protein